MNELIDLIRTFLNNRGLKFIESPRTTEFNFILRFRDFNIRINISENGEFIAIYARGIWDKAMLEAMDDKFKMKIFNTILLENYSNKLSKWSFDPSDGDLVLSVEIAIEDGNLTERQFNRALTYVLLDSRNVFPQINNELNSN